MTRAGLALAAGILALGIVLWGGLRHPAPPPDRGPAGIDFVIPADYRILDLGESTTEAAAGVVLLTLDEAPRVAARFTHAGDRIQLLADRTEDTVEERVMGGQGTVHRVMWPDSARVRLAWAREHGEFAAPGLPPATSRNPYH